MLPTDPAVYLTPMALLTLIASFVQIRKNESDLSRRKKEIEQKIYETLVLREIGERIGYELNYDKILDTITGSLGKLIPFSVASYLLRNPKSGKIDWHLLLEESVNRKFLDDLRGKMLANLNAATGRSDSPESVLEAATGTIIDEGLSSPLTSLWMMVLMVGNQAVGVLAIASVKPNLYRGPEMEVLNKILAQATRAVSNLERVLATEEEKLTSLVASMADGVLMLDANMNLLIINPAAATLLDLPGDKKPTILEVAQALSDKMDLRSKIEESISGNHLVTFDNLVVGDQVSRLLISPVRGVNQVLLGAVVLFHDITAQKELERVREEFTAMMVHELRAPLTVVRGATDMFLRQPQMTTQAQGQELLKTVQGSAGAMLSLVNDLLDVAKIEAGKFQIVKIKANLGEIIKDRVLFFTQLATPKSISVTTDVTTDNLEAEMDRERITQVLNNLLSNAVKFTPVGGRITLSAYRINQAADIHWRYPETAPRDLLSGPAILVCVADTGVGIPPDRLSELFSKFKQLRPAEGNGQGTGLGLVIAKGIVESHGGKIFVQSRPNEGSAFYFTIPG